MTKREMIMEMVEGLNFAGGNEKVIKNRCKNTKAKIESVYNKYLTTNKTKEDKIICLTLLVVW